MLVNGGLLQRLIESGALLVVCIHALQVSKTMQKEAEMIAERGTRAFVSAPSRTEIILKAEKQESETWARYLHVQMNCVRCCLAV